jgi:MFS family permease
MDCISSLIGPIFASRCATLSEPPWSGIGMIAPVLRFRRSLVLISLASMGWAFSFGLGATLAPLWLQDAGCAGWLIGLNTSGYYLGVALAAPFVPWLMGRTNRWCVVAGMLLDAVSTALFPWVEGVWLWGLLRLAGGVGTALSLIPLETLVNHRALPERRARDFAVYAVAVALGIGLGSAVGLPLYPLVPRLVFALGGGITLAALVPVWWEIPRRCIHGEEGSGRLSLTPADGMLSLGTAWVQGFLEGGTLTFLSIYLLELGYSEAGAGGLLSGLFLGVVLAQLPMAWLADRLGRLGVLLVCHAVVLTGLLWLPCLVGPVGVGGWLFLLGASCGALYPLGLALLGERVPAGSLARANAWYLACNCAGSLSGPAVMGLAVDGFGPRGLFGAGVGAVVLVLAGWLGLVRAQSRDRKEADGRAQSRDREEADGRAA